MYNLMKVVGIFRGGGDTKFSMFAELTCVWLIGVPMALLGSLVLKLSVVYVVCMILTEEVVKTIIARRRFKSEKWVHNIIHQIK